MGLSALGTKARNARTAELNRMPVTELLAAMNAEDRTVALTVRTALPRIADAVGLITGSLRRGARLIHLGAAPTAGSGCSTPSSAPLPHDPGQVLTLLAGGPNAFAAVVEGAEEDPHCAVAQFQEAGLDGTGHRGRPRRQRPDAVRRRRPRPRPRGRCHPDSVARNDHAVISAHADVAIEVVTGPEVLTGSTRLKGGSGQRMVCNMPSTTAMVRTCKAYRNLMVDVRPRNDKVVERARQIVAEAAGTDVGTATDALGTSGAHARTAIVLLLADCSHEEAVARLERSAGDVRTAVSGS